MLFPAASVNCLVFVCLCVRVCLCVCVCVCTYDAYYSNVLEKCLLHGSQAEVAGLIEELCEQDRYVI